MAKRHRQPAPFPLPSNQAVPLNPPESQEETQVRLKRAVDGIQEVLSKNRAVIAVNKFNLTDDGRMLPEISIKLLK